MPTQEEVSFPRGGNAPAFDNKKVSKKSKPFKRKTDDSSTSGVRTSAKKAKLTEPKCLLDLSSKALSQGLVVLGCVREVNDIEIKVNLPGRIVGYVPATNISTEYSAYLKQLLDGEEKEPQELQNMFKPGQFVVTKVEEVLFQQDDMRRMCLTLVPEIIQRSFSISCMMKGLILSASVQSIEDHGYIMNCGIAGVRAFLKKSRASNFEKRWNDGRPLGIGQVLRCLIVKYISTDGYSKLELQADPEAVANAIIKDITIPLGSLIPGMCFELSVSKVTLSGLEVMFNGDQVGYVHSNYIQNDKNIEEGSELQGRVLYIEPLTRRVFFTSLNNVCGPNPLPNPFHKITRGQIFKKVKVIYSNINDHVEVQLKKGAIGYVTIKHLDINENDEIEIPANAIKRYCVGSSHGCKVLEYDYMIQKYNCSLNSRIMRQKIWSLDDVCPGRIMECTVVKSTPIEIELSIGSVHGIVEPVHCTDEPVGDPDTLFVKGQRVKARVLSVKSPICEFTLKPLLVESRNPILTGFDEAKCDVPYDGVIVAIKDHGVLVKFYADFKTFVPAKRVMKYGTTEFRKKYYVGQVVLCYVQQIDAKEQKLVMTVQPALQIETNNEVEPSHKHRVIVGKPYNVYVNEVSPEGLFVQEEVSGVTGLIPPTQLSDSPQMATLLCQTYKEGDVLQTYCLRYGDTVLFTISPTFINYFKSSFGEKITEKGKAALEKNIVVLSTVVDVGESGITVSIPMLKNECRISIPTNQICDGTVRDADSLDIQMHQTMFVQITEFFNDAPCVASCRLSRVWDKTTLSKFGILLLQDFFNCQKRIHNYLKNEGHSLGDLQVGSQVTGTVTTVTTFGAVVELDCGTRAVVLPKHYEDLNLEENMSVEGTVLYIDVLNQCVEISLSRDVYEMFSSLGDLPHVGKAAMCLVLVSRPEVVVGAISLSGRKAQIVYVPSRWHVNDIHPSPYFECSERGKINIKICEDGVVIAVPRKIEVAEKKAQLQITNFSPLHYHNTSSPPLETLDINGTEKNSIGIKELNNATGSSEINGKGNMKKEKRKKKKTMNSEMNICNTKDSLSNGHENMLIDETIELKREKNKKVSDETFEKHNGISDSNEQYLLDENVEEQLKNENSCDLNISLQSPSVSLLLTENEPQKVKNKAKKQKSKISNTLNLDMSQLSIDKMTSPQLENAGGVIVKTIQEKNSAPTKRKLKETESVSERNPSEITDKSESVEKKKRKKKDESKKKVVSKDDQSKISDIKQENKEKIKKSEDPESKNRLEDKNSESNHAKVLKVNAGFFWNATLDQISSINGQNGQNVDSSSDDEETEIVMNKKKKQRLSMAEKRELARQEEERLRKIEERLMEAEKNPQSADDFDRLVISAPNNSQNWIKYMAYHLEATEVEKARTVAQRALKTISFREEQDKLNVWMALLNLENLFGTSESFDKTLEEAVKMNDAYKVYMQSVNMFSMTKRFEELNKMVQLVTKKYKDQKNTWIEAGMAYIKCGEIEKSRQLMQRSLKVLDRKNHIEVLTRFARMENEWGESERAETILENILTSYPKRVDVLCVYVDMLTKSKKLELARQVLDRAVIQKLPALKMKSLFKKYIKFEQDHGTPEGVAKVREMAKNYVENLNT